MDYVIKHSLGIRRSQKLALIKKSMLIRLNRAIRRYSVGIDGMPDLPMRKFVSRDAHLFFGYYDVPQFSRDENLLLATAAPLLNTTPTPDDQLRIGYFDLREEKPEFRELGSTSTWCWQQGCRLQWYPYQSQESVLYNDLFWDHYGCAIREVQSGKLIKSLPRPIYAVSRNGGWGLSLNFSRLQRLRPGYGYNTLPDNSKQEMAPTGDGIWRINMETGDEQLLFSVRDIAEFEKSALDADAQHYFNHLLFNIAGDRFMFFHIAQLSDGKRRIRLLTSGVDGKNIRLLNGSGHASHYFWKDNDHLLCYSTVTGKGEGYFLYDENSCETQILGEGVLKEDGHPSYLPDGKTILTDTYPDKYGEIALLLYNCERNRITILDKEFTPVIFHDETRCDFHPRISPSGKFVCIDCIINGKRAMKLFDIRRYLEN